MKSFSTSLAAAALLALTACGGSGGEEAANNSAAAEATASDPSLPADDMIVPADESSASDADLNGVNSTLTSDLNASANVTNAQ